MKFTVYCTVQKITDIVKSQTNENFDKKIINFQTIESKKILAVQCAKYFFPQIDELLIGSEVKIEVEIDYFSSKEDKSIIYNSFTLRSLKAL